jgi:hypothetical protein
MRRDCKHLCGMSAATLTLCDILEETMNRVLAVEETLLCRQGSAHSQH